ncbi:Crinkler (CRN) family protein, partial [Phytophthora palmivora]
LSVSGDEFRLDSLSTMQQSDRPIVMTPGLHKFWKEFGEFPLYYFVRMEEVVFWEVIKRPLFGKARVVIVGSPVVGKSCFRMLTVFYLACIEKKKVLVIRRLKERGQTNAVDVKNEYVPFNFLATSCQYDVKHDDSSRIVVLPAWRDADLLQYAKLTDWVIKTGLRKTKQENTLFQKLIREQYFYFDLISTMRQTLAMVSCFSPEQLEPEVSCR